MVESTMTLSLLSSRDADPNITFTLSFNVSFGPPSRIVCYRDNKPFTHLIGRAPQPGVVREVIRSHYVSSSQPDMTRVTVITTHTRAETLYGCDVFAEGRVGLDGNGYGIHKLGQNGYVETTVTGKCDCRT